MMTLENFYKQMGGSYADVRSRIPGDSLILKLINEFRNDPSYESLNRAFADGNAEEAFCAAHTLKGVCANLGFEKLRCSAGKLTEALRFESETIPQAAFLLWRCVQTDYHNAADIIVSFLEEK